ncbi:MAG: hypothetical protein U0353_33195 [Sandaracinus sp.]
MRSLTLLFAMVLWPSTALAQTVGIASVETLRARAAERGFTRAAPADVSGPRHLETWCASPPCDADEDRFELTLEGEALVALHVVDHAAGEGFALDGTWQASGAFGFRFRRGDEAIDLTWELSFEPPGLDVGFSARDLDAMTALDPSDGARAFTLWITAELSRHLASATSLREAGLASRATLRRAVARGLASSAVIREGSPQECLVERSTPQGTGVFDTCTMRRATPEEQRAALAILDARLARERRLLRRHFRAFHHALAATFAASGP